MNKNSYRGHQAHRRAMGGEACAPSGRQRPGQTAGFRLTSDWTIRLPGWEGVLLRLVSYQLPDGKLIRVLTDRFDLSARSRAQLYKERWTIENWWKWVKQMFKIKHPLGESENALPVQIVSAFVTDLLLRAFKHIAISGRIGEA
jgi:IS4 transposase